MASKSKSLPKRVTLKDVANATGVSTAAVSYAYTRPERLSVKLRSRIMETARELGYPGPNPVAQNLRRGQTGVVGVVFHDPLPEAFTDPSTVLFLRGVADMIEAGNFCLLLIPGSVRRARNLKFVNSAAVDGMIVYSIHDRDPLVDAALARQVPTVLVDSGAMEQVLTIGIDNEAAAQVAAEHLLALGHRRFGIVVAGPTVDATRGIMTFAALQSATSADVRGRLKGYAKALKKARISFSECVSIINCGQHTQDEGRIAGQTLMGLNPRPTAILAMSDQLALGAMQGIAEVGLRVPNDVSVVGFDDIPAAAAARPSLTTIHQPLIDKGFWSAKMLLALIQHEQPPNPNLLPTHLVVRESTGPASIREEVVVSPSSKRSSR